MKYNFLFSKAVITGFFCILIVLSGWLGTTQFQTKVHSLPLFLDVKYQCDQALSENENVLRIYLPMAELAEQLKPYFCQNSVVAKQFGQVQLHWGNTMSDALDFIGRGNAELIMTKENLMLAFEGKQTFNYRALLAYPDYTAFFISLSEKPKLTKAYFVDKRIGLLDYPSSRSGYILPRMLFKQLDLNTESLDIVQASSHSALRDLLAEGKVDLIASYWKDDDMTRFLQNYITPISDNVSGSRWYFKKTTENTELMCAINAIIKSHARAQASPYYRDVESYVTCP